MDLFKKDKGKLVKRAEKYLAKREIEKGVEIFSKALEGDTPRTHLLNTIGDLYLKMGNEAEAKKFFLEAAQEYVNEGKHAMAIATYRKLQRIDPENLDVALSLTDLCIKKGWKDEAIHNLRNITANALSAQELDSAQLTLANKVLALEEKMLTLNPNDADVLIDCGHLLRKLGRVKDYFDAMRKAVAVLKDQGRLERCLEVIAELRALEPDNADLLALTCDLLVSLKREAEAVSLLDDALKRKDKDLRLLKLYSQTLMRIGDYDRAAQVYYRLLAIDAAGFDEATDFAHKLIDNRQLERAVAWLRQLLEQASMLQRSEIAYLLRKIIAVDPDNAGARELLGQIIQHSTEETGAYTTYGSGVGLDDKEPHLAEAIAESLLEPPTLDDNETSVDDFLASIELLKKYGYIERAIEILRARATSEPENPIYRERLLSLYRECHMLAEATIECLELFKLYRDRKQTDKAQEILKLAFQLNPSLAFKLAESGRVLEAQRQYEKMKAFSGNLETFSLLDIIQFIDTSRKTGTLKVNSPQGQGKVLFNEGQIADAEFEQKLGIAAIYELIRVTEGSFEFEAASRPFPSKINLSTINLLLEGLKLFDEERARKEGLGSSER